MSLTHALDAKISREFADAFGDEVVRELSSDGDAELSEALERALHSADVSAARRVVEVTYDALRKGKTWPKPSWREAFVLAQLRVCVESLRECEESGRRDKAGEAVRAADMTLIVGAPGEAVRSFIEAAESLLDVPLDTNAYEASVEGSGMLLPDSAPSVDWGERRWLRRLDEPISAKEFKREYYSTETPVVMTGVGSEWPAMKKWKDLAWWRRFHGHRFVPLELGRYSDEDNWREEVKSMEDFISQDMVPAMSASGARDQAVAYLAQHQLIEQISSLSADFTPPEYCRKSLERINVWMGTGGTITPCHFDTYDNLLGQVRASYFVCRRVAFFLYLAMFFSPFGSFTKPTCQRRVSVGDTNSLDQSERYRTEISKS